MLFAGSAAAWEARRAAGADGAASAEGEDGVDDDGEAASAKAKAVEA
jgi:hypothetical protein